MRLLHISDWHLGRVTYNCSRVPDHEQVISEIVLIAKDFRPHLICHTGDLFDGLRPSYGELERAVGALQELAAVAPVVVLCGNHDSPALFRLFGALVGNESGVRFIDKARPPRSGGILEFSGHRDEIIRLAPLPFVHANRLVEYLEDPSSRMVTYADRINEIETALGRGLTTGYDVSRHVLVFAAHLHVAGALFSGSERPLHVTDTYASRLEHIPQVSYAAFGHIHRPQPLPGTTVAGRYAGSPIALDFGEEGEAKSVVLVEASPGRPSIVKTSPLSGGRPLRRLGGAIQELEQIAPSIGRALCLVTVHTEEPLPDLSDRIRKLFPQAELLQVIEDCAARHLTILSSSDIASDVELSFTEMFRDYLATQGTKGSEADVVMCIFERLLRAVEQEEEAEFDKIALLDERLTEQTLAP